MDSSRLTKKQCEELGAVVGRQLNFLIRLRTRMEKLAFPPKDPLYVKVSKAFDAVHSLNVGVHNLTVKEGVGRPSTK